MHLIGTLLVACLLVEMLLYFVAPHAYAFTARLPLGPARRLVLQPDAIEALRAPATDAAARGGYRESAARPVELGRLELPEKLETDGLVFFFDAASGYAIARFPYSFATRVYGMVRVDLVAAGGALELRPRFMVMGWPTLFALLPVATIAVVATMNASRWTQHFLTGALFVGINVVLGLIFGRTRLETGVNEIERQIQAALVAAGAGH